MNPIVVIGLVSVVVAGMYGVYDGLEKQAELAALHADMLARQHAEHSVFVHGEVQDDGTNIIFVNNGPQPAELVQVRAYDTSVEPAPLVNTWQVSYELPPLGRFNLTDASAPLPPPPSALTGTTLKNALDADTSYRGVTSAGGIFEITYDPSSAIITPDGAFGPMSAIEFDRGSGSRSHAGGVTTVAYYYSDPSITCKTRYAVAGTSYTKYYDFIAVYNQPYSVSTTGPGPTYTHQPAGSASWDYFVFDRTGSDMTSILHCSNYGTVIDGIPGPQQNESPQNFPTYITQHSTYGNVFYRTLSTTSTTVNLSLPLDGEFTAPADGEFLIRVDAPVSATTSASYDGSDQLMFVNNVCLSQADYPPIDYETVTENTVSQWKSSLGSPALTSSLNVRINGVSAGSLGLSDVVLTDSSGVGGRNYVFDRWADGGGWDCTLTLTADVDGSWLHGGTLAGWMTVNVLDGDLVEIDGTVRLRYTPPSVTDATIDTTGARLELDDPLFTVGLLHN